MIELETASPERQKAFNCSVCPLATQELRRCREDRWDFTYKDSGLFPIYIEQGGNAYSFCPGKATWDGETLFLYKALVVAAETGIMLEKGSLIDQPEWWVDLLSWFIPAWSDSRFYSRARAILGDGKASNNGNNNRRASSTNRNTNRKL